MPAACFVLLFFLFAFFIKFHLITLKQENYRFPLVQYFTINKFYIFSLVLSTHPFSHKRTRVHTRKRNHPLTQHVFISCSVSLLLFCYFSFSTRLLPYNWSKNSSLSSKHKTKQRLVLINEFSKLLFIFDFLISQFSNQFSSHQLSLFNSQRRLSQECSIKVNNEVINIWLLLESFSSKNW